VLTASTTTLLFAGSTIALTLGVAAWLIERQRSLAVTLSKFGGPPATDRATSSRAQRNASWEGARTDLVPLSAAEATRFSQRWYTLQGRFVDNPRAVVAEADRLVHELLEKRGCLHGTLTLPVGMVEPLPDLPFDHSVLVTTYIAAQAITARHGRHEPDTEVLRKVFVYYRALLTELLVEP
jgi:hypothetical protein